MNRLPLRTLATALLVAALAATATPSPTIAQTPASRSTTSTTQTSQSAAGAPDVTADTTATAANTTATAANTTATATAAAVPKTTGRVRSPGEVSQITTELSHSVYSPFCPGKTLAMCPSGGAADVRRDIQQMAAKGMEKVQIKEEIYHNYRERYVEVYGEDFRITEPPSSDEAILLAALIAGLGLALIAIVVFWRRTRRPDDQTEREDVARDQAAATDGSLEHPEAAGAQPDAEDLDERDREYLEDLRDEYRD
jgi:cytochrome c-type biogenesis protein CcmH/NrfF